MAVNEEFRPVTGALRPAPGLIRVVGLRLGLVILSSLPALIAALGGVAGGVARRPYYTDVQGRLPLVHLVRLMKELPGSFVPAAIVGAVLAVLGDQILLGGALSLFDPARPAEPRVKVFATVFKDGLTHLWAFLRAMGLGLLLWVIGIALIRVLSGRLDILGYRSSWTGLTSVLRVPLLTTSLTLIWIASAGAWLFWCRLITAADGRRRVRRTGLLVFRVFRRHPLRSWGLFTGLTLLTTLAPAAILVGWRQAEPRGGALAFWLLLWLVGLVVQSFVWLWLVRAGRLLYASEGLSDVRAMPDDPFRLFSTLLSKVLWWRKKPASAALPPDESSNNLTG